jgi:predicted small metal-binding protein
MKKIFQTSILILSCVFMTTAYSQDETISEAIEYKVVDTKIDKYKSTMLEEILKHDPDSLKIRASNPYEGCNCCS